ncbi:MAG: glutathione S-transferase family protein [Acetobacteraceae bacterium]|nr:glutathione S-transferase family protein [Acetobacteraceae bacterium]
MTAAAMKIYGIPQSRAARCLWMARELGLPHENVPVHFRATRESPALLKANPNARVPALEEPGGFTLYESMAINLYLAKKHGAATPLAPAGLEEDALATQWSFWAMTEIEKPLLTLLLHAAGMRPQEDAALDQARAELVRPLDVLEAHLADRDWLMGGRFSVADLNVASVMAWAKGGKLDLGPWPKVAAWLGRCLGRPAFKG